MRGGQAPLRHVTHRDVFAIAEPGWAWPERDVSGPKEASRSALPGSALRAASQLQRYRSALFRRCAGMRRFSRQASFPLRRAPLAAQAEAVAEGWLSAERAAGWTLRGPRKGHVSAPPPLLGYWNAWRREPNEMATYLQNTTK